MNQIERGVVSLEDAIRTIGAATYLLQYPWRKADAIQALKDAIKQLEQS